MLRACAIAACLAGPAAAQDTAPAAPPGGFQAGSLLVIDRGRVFAESRWGRDLLGRLDADGRALAAENREIEERLREEERALTERRSEMEPAAFREEAEAFDLRVQEIRDTQDAKRRELLSRRETLEDAFWEGALPVLARILQERGAVVVLDRDGVFLSSDSADITSEVIARIDAAEAALPLAPEAPATPPPAPEAEPEADGLAIGAPPPAASEEPVDPG